MLTIDRQSVDRALMAAMHRVSQGFSREFETMSFALASYRDGLVSRQAMSYMVYELTQDGLTLAALAQRVGVLDPRSREVMVDEFRRFKDRSVYEMSNAPLHQPSAGAFLEDDCAQTMATARELIRRVSEAAAQQVQQLQPRAKDSEAQSDSATSGEAVPVPQYTPAEIANSMFATTSRQVASAPSKDTVPSMADLYSS